jgi:hypothetical protein
MAQDRPQTDPFVAALVGQVERDAPSGAGMSSGLGEQPTCG